MPKITLCDSSWERVRNNPARHHDSIYSLPQVTPKGSPPPSTALPNSCTFTTAGARSCGSEPAPHPPSTPSAFLVFGICSTAGSPQELPIAWRCVLSWNRVGTSEGPHQTFKQPLQGTGGGTSWPSSKLQAWCSEHPCRAGAQRVALHLSEGARLWQVGVNSAPCKRCCCHRQAEAKKRGEKLH